MSWCLRDLKYPFAIDKKKYAGVLGKALDWRQGHVLISACIEDDSLLGNCPLWKQYRTLRVKKLFAKRLGKEARGIRREPGNTVSKAQQVEIKRQRGTCGMGFLSAPRGWVTCILCYTLSSQATLSNPIILCVLQMRQMRSKGSLSNLPDVTDHNSGQQDSNAGHLLQVFLFKIPAIRCI